MLGKLKDLTINHDGTQSLTIDIQCDFSEAFDELKNNDIDVTIKRFAKKRSLDANSKAWVLIDALAEKLRIPKKEVYRNAIREIGGVSTVVCVRSFAAERLCKNWEKQGMGWMSEVTQSKLPDCVNVTLWYGSSTYNSKQMADLIGFLVEECNEQGIPTMSESEIERTLALWGKKVEKSE